MRTTLDPKLQVLARKQLIDGLVRFDETQGYRGPVTKLEPAGEWGGKLAEVKALSDVAPWRLAVVLEATDQSARIGFQPAREAGGGLSKERETGILTLEGVKWAKPHLGTDQRQGAGQGLAGARDRRRRLCRAARRQGRPVQAAANP